MKPQTDAQIIARFAKRTGKRYRRTPDNVLSVLATFAGRKLTRDERAARNMLAGPMGRSPDILYRLANLGRFVKATAAA